MSAKVCEHSQAAVVASQRKFIIYQIPATIKWPRCPTKFLFRSLLHFSQTCVYLEDRFFVDLFGCKWFVFGEMTKFFPVLKFSEFLRSTKQLPFRNIKIGDAWNTAFKFILILLARILVEQQTNSYDSQW